MSSTIDPEREIERTLNAVAFILDAGEYDRMGEVFHEDVLFSNPGRLEAQGLAEVQAAFSAIANPARSHSVTNVIVSLTSPERATAVCKALTVRADGEVAPAEYRDVLALTGQGWRIIERRIRQL
jgi:ketosteroid isomerase-like protein